MRITRVLAAECSLPLPRPIRLGPVEIKTREFVALRLETDSGLCGDALGYPRGGPLIEAVGRMAPYVVGTDAGMRRRTVDSFLQRFVNSRPAYIKAASLVDIALWDLAAKQSQQPLYRMLGGFRNTVPVMVVAGYYMDQRTIEDVCDEVRKRVAAGFQRIKIMIGGTDPEDDARLVAAAQKVAGDRLCVDAHWTWRSVPEALRTCRRLDSMGLQFIEDPFGPYQCDLTTELQGHLQTPLACGEDLPDAQTLSRMLDEITVLRLDATTCGGVTHAIAIAEKAALLGHAVLPHVFLPIHAQLAGALRSIDAVELIPVEVGACPMFDLLEGTPDITDGTLRIDDEPGAGLRLDWSSVERFARHTLSQDQSAL
ncbi:MAG: mandelate racemase/muconate lactonizing enzyme family protein [Devosia sp.]